MNILTEIRKIEQQSNWTINYFWTGYVIIFFQLLSGTILFFTEDMSTFDMMQQLYHISLGFFLVVPLIMLISRHKMYSKIILSKAFLWIGRTTIGLLCLSLITGFVVIFTGKSGHLILWWTHNIASWGFIVFIFVYFGSMILSSLSAAKDSHKLRLFIKDFILNNILKVFLGIAVLYTMVWISSYLYPTTDPNKEVPGYTRPFTELPFVPGKLRTVSGGFYKEKIFTRSKSCGTSGCHTEIHNQWENSIHSKTPNAIVTRVEQLLINDAKEGKAFKNPNFKNHGREAFRLCAACHAPVSLLSGNVVSGAPLESHKAREGISCIFCHSLHDTNLIGGGGGDNLVRPPKRYLFPYEDNPILQFINETLISTKPEFHKKTFNKKFYKTTKACVGCHNGYTLISWTKSEYYNNKDHSKKKDCHSCHMPQIKSDNDVSARVKGTIADHRFLGANYLIPLLLKQEQKFKDTVAFLKDDTVQIYIEAPRLVKKGSKVPFVVRVVNEGIGHGIPAGPASDLIQAWPEIVVRSLDKKTLLEQGTLDQDGYLNVEDSFYYRFDPYDQYKLSNNRHRSWNFSTELVYSLGPREYDEFSFEVKPSDSVIISGRFRYRKVNQKFADWMFGKGNFVVPIINMATAQKVIKFTDSSADAEKALREWRTEISTASKMSEFKRYDRNNPYKKYKMKAEDLIHLNIALEFNQAGQVGKALQELDRLSDPGKSLKWVKRLRRKMKRKMKRTTR